MLNFKQQTIVHLTEMYKFCSYPVVFGPRIHLYVEVFPLGITCVITCE
jgi:hypothetical protein